MDDDVVGSERQKGTELKGWDMMSWGEKEMTTRRAAESVCFVDWVVDCDAEPDFGVGALFA